MEVTIANVREIKSALVFIIPEERVICCDFSFENYVYALVEIIESRESQRK